MPAVLVIDDEEVIREGCRRVLQRAGWAVETAASPEEALERLASESFEVILLDLRLPGVDGLELLPRLKALEPGAEVVVITGWPSIESAVQAMRLGAYDYLAKPLDPDSLRLTVGKALEVVRLRNQNEHLRRRLSAAAPEETLVGESKAMQRVLRLIEKVAPTDSTVLITGESGTGKELVARAIHRLSPRRDREFVTVDCGALVETLLESELFGHVKGSFTGAYQTKHGSFELADGGTFFFDEVGNLSLGMQAKLLRVIQERQIRPVGGSRWIKVDVRIIAATNQDLQEAVRRGAFREDLYYRLSVVPIHLPPLRERREDIPLLAHHFLQKYNRRRKRPVERISEEALRLMMSYDWPGNVRELENAIERALILAEGDELMPQDLPWHVQRQRPLFPSGRRCTLRELEREYIRTVLDETRGNKLQAARILGIDRKTLYAKLRRYRLI